MPFEPYQFSPFSIQNFIIEHDQDLILNYGDLYTIKNDVTLTDNIRIRFSLVEYGHYLNINITY